MRAVDTEQVWTHIFEEDKELPSEEQTEFDLNILDVNQEAFLEDKLGSMNDDGFNVKLGTQNLIALHIGMAGVRKLLDGKGNAVVMERDMAAKPVYKQIRPWKAECLTRIPKDKRAALAKLILAGPKLKEVEAKN